MHVKVSSNPKLNILLHANRFDYFNGTVSLWSLKHIKLQSKYFNILFNEVKF